MGRTFVTVVGFCCTLLTLGGCTRSHYRLRADGEAYSILAEKSACGPWGVPEGFSVYPDPRSRFFDQSLSDDPALPVPAPQLYAYQLPELPERDPARFRPNSSGEQNSAVASDSVPQRLRHVGQFAQLAPASWASELRRLPPPPRREPSGPRGDHGERPTEPGRLCLPRFGGSPDDSYVQLAQYQESLPPDAPPSDTAPDSSAALELDYTDQLEELTVVPVPADVWESIPRKCLARMFEFESVRDEYERTYGRQPPEELRDQSQRLALEDIVQLAEINQRAFQTRREDLYQTALTLSLQRFNYDLKFATSGNGTAANYTHNRAAGITVDTLRVPTEVNSDRVLSTGGDFLARFANNVVLTFNGPEGFAADVGSSLLFDLSQRVFQRDIIFESLTQAERNVVYAARDFGRARKELFVNLAGQYYELLLTYRSIEIATQDYFSNLRGFLQAEAESENAGLPRFQVDQFEQRALSSRSSLIATCNLLELNLDRLKLAIGLPPELPINLNLLELEELTLGDEVVAAAERVERARRRLASVRAKSKPPRDEMLNEAIRLVTEALSLLDLRQRRGETITGIESLETELAMLRADEARLVVRQRRNELANVEKPRTDTEQPPPPQSLIRRRAELVEALLQLARRELAVAKRIGVDPEKIARTRLAVDGLQARYDRLQEALVLEEDEQPADVLVEEPALLRDSDQLLTDAEATSVDADSLLPSRRIDPQGELQDTLGQVDQLLSRSQQLLEKTEGGLVPVEIALDEAMLTALTLRYDVMTQREQVADAWRVVKLAADDLKSVLNLNAAQTIRTRSDVNRPFDFTFDDSQTRLSVQFDAPLNRKQQRNAFRNSLINYNRALRTLIAVEDQIKFDIRDDLRQLGLQREQYQIAVASAALAYQRRVSTNLQYRLGQGNIRAFDVLEAQRDYTQSLVDLARRHINYIQQRITLFLDLELLVVDDDQFWPQLYDERYQPKPNYQLPGYAQPAYGQLPDRVLYSKKIRRMLHVPPGQSVIFRADSNDADEMEEVPTPAAEPLPPVETTGEPLPEPPED